MASQFWQPGTVALLAGPQNCAVGSLVFCGVGTFSPETQFLPKYKPIHDDWSGGQIEAESGFGGEEAFVSIDFSRYDQAAMNLLANYLVAPANFTLPAGAGAEVANRGKYAFGAIGTLMQTEGYYTSICLVNMNMLPAGFGAFYPNQPPGYFFPCGRTVQLVLPRKELADAQLTRASFEMKNLRTMNAGLMEHDLYRVLTLAEITQMQALIS